MESEGEYRELYAESKRSEEVYRSLLHSSADAIVIYDMEGSVRYISPAFSRIFGWTLADVEGKEIPFLPESERESTRIIIRDLVEKGTPCHGFETTRYTRDGHLIDVSISASRYNDHNGQPAGKLFILRDISEKKKLESQLKFVERMETIGTLAGGIAHDFNNLMMGMLGNTSLLLYEIDAAHPHYEKLKNIEKLIESGSKLTSQILGFARKGRYEVRPINLNQVVQETSVTFGRTRKDITIHRKLSEDLFSVKVDEHQIEQVLMNLYINAADAMPDGGDLFLKTLNVTHKEMKDKPYNPKPGQYILLNVIDNGTGMDEKTAERIFEPFFTTKEMGRGTGLGLASAYGIIKGHGGYIDVDSKKDQGTNFSIYLPASDEPIHQTMEISKRILAGNETIFLIDDEEMVMDVGVALLNKLGYTVLEAMNGYEAIEVYKANKDKIDLVILDMIMPYMGGGETYDTLKKIDSEVKVLLSSGYSLSGQASEILDRGCNGFIQKPFNMRNLSQKIREVLSDDKR
jgi:PAS domain S-box-containing protein